MPDYAAIFPWRKKRLKFQTSPGYTNTGTWWGKMSTGSLKLQRQVYTW